MWFRKLWRELVGPRGGERTWVKLADLKLGPIQHPTLTPDQAERIRRLHQRLAPVDGLSLEKRTDLFMRDVMIDTELAVCERIADVCDRLYQEMGPLSHEQRGDIYGLLCLASMCASATEVLDHCNPRTITLDQAKHVLARW